MEVGKEWAGNAVISTPSLLPFYQCLSLAHYTWKAPEREPRWCRQKGQLQAGGWVEKGGQRRVSGIAKREEPAKHLLNDFWGSFQHYLFMQNFSTPKYTISNYVLIKTEKDNF